MSDGPRASDIDPRKPTIAFAIVTVLALIGWFL